MLILGFKGLKATDWYLAQNINKRLLLLCFFFNQQLQANMAEQQRNMDYLNSTGDKFVKSLPRQKSEQLRSKLADLNDKWRDINLHAEKRQNQVRT